MRLLASAPPQRRIWFTAALVLACVLGLACSGSDDDRQAAGVASPSATAGVASATATEPATPTPAATATPEPPRRPDADPFPPDLRAVAEPMFAEIAALWGRPAAGTVDMFLLTREQARAYYYPETEDDEEDEEPREPSERPLDPKNELYRLLGLIPEPEPAQEPSGQSRDVDEQAVDNLISLITGFYAADLKAFYMLAEIEGGVTGGSALSTMAHEFVHALQDQYYDLNKLAAQRGDDWDAYRALQQVLEGDAMSTETAYRGFSLRSTYREPQCFEIPLPSREGVAFVVERELDTWYEDGYCFVEAVKDDLPGGAADIWEDLPVSTEEVLHPEKYLAGEQVVPVSLRDLAETLGEGWRQLESSSFGEFSLQNLLLLGLDDRPLVQAAAAGWGGDAWSLYVSGGARLLHYEVAWDSVAEAGEFWSALGQSLAARAAGGIEGGEAGLRATIGNTTWLARLDGDRVTLLVANDEPALAAAAAALGLS